MSVEPQVKGWCPGAHRPMLSGDGLVVRVRPRAGRLERDQAVALAGLALRFGNGTLDLTSRANLQIRGVAEDRFPDLLSALADLDLLDEDAEIESRRNIIVTPFRELGDLTDRLAEALARALPRFPALPAKIGMVVDTGPARVLTEASADFRLERSREGGLILRADGADLGTEVTEQSAVDAVVDMAHWLAQRVTASRRRMHAVLAVDPEGYPGARTPAAPAAPAQFPGAVAQGSLVGAPFGQLPAEALARLLNHTATTGLRLTPWRMFLLEGVAVPYPADEAGFVTRPGDPLLAADACPGAPYCPSASVETRGFARSLAPHVTGGLHVSGCAKGCARARPAGVTLVGRNGRFDLVRQGHAWDEPELLDLTPDQILKTLI
ncbi:cobalamin biosynthesis protein CobG [Chachezhania sediminis]|uniref:cobalamin biosynthesis protein CobG n=1 Tax=Chachezhania sediminis TaxID=2599291 RepID=UPI00131BC240|nr:cobalamin biosynthesis protein CobG [Chachezhania sediminis]